jgi:2-iminobutanoate/2-iminopropanoate deaminase
LRTDIEGRHSIIFVAGHTTRLDDDGQPVGQDIDTQARETLEGIRATLAASGAELSDIVQLTAFVTEPEFIEPFLAVRGELFTEPFPASLTVVAQMGRPDLFIEIQAIAMA